MLAYLLADGRQLFVSLLYRIWLSRNKLCFEQKPDVQEMTTSLAISTLGEMRQVPISI